MMASWDDDFGFNPNALYPTDPVPAPDGDPCGMCASPKRRRHDDGLYCANCGCKLDGPVGSIDLDLHNDLLLLYAEEQGYDRDLLADRGFGRHRQDGGL